MEQQGIRERNSSHPGFVRIQETKVLDIASIFIAKFLQRKVLFLILEVLAVLYIGEHLFSSYVTEEVHDLIKAHLHEPGFQVAEENNDAFEKSFSAFGNEEVHYPENHVAADCVLESIGE